MGKVISEHQSKESWSGQNKIHNDKGVSSLRRHNSLKCECPRLQGIEIYGANSDRITLLQKQPKKTLLELINNSKLQDKKWTHKNGFYFYTLDNPKKEIKRQNHLW